MSRTPYRTAPVPSPGMPPGVPYIIGNEAAERFSFYGMRTILVIFMVKYLHLMGANPGEPMSNAEAGEAFHKFVANVYLFPIFGALIADLFFGKYRTIIWLSIVYCLGHGLLALMGSVGSAETLLYWGLMCIAIGSGGIKPCVSAHVGDQFGKTNRHLLTRIFNWFYFSINLGAFVSTLMTPILLHWYGPHWAFGVPGVLMAIATIVFWMGRHQFIHVPAKGLVFLKELCTWQGISALLRLMVIYLFVAVFWALFDQTGSSWVLQAQDMNRNWLGFEWLPSQVQAINPIMILLFIPLFTYLIYPAIDKVFKLTPLRKISIGLFVMVLGFGLVALVQEWIDAGQRPSIGWQVLAYALITAAEVMVSIVCLEFSYTQAPRSMKSVVMALFLWSVSLGNYFTAGVNHFIQVPNPLTALDESASAAVGSEGGGDRNVTPSLEQRSPGPDETEGTDDDIVTTYDEFGGRTAVQYAARETIENAAEVVRAEVNAREGAMPNTEEGNRLLEGVTDPWGEPLEFRQLNSRQVRILSKGPDKEAQTQWDQGMILEVVIPEAESSDRWYDFLLPDQPWLESRMEILGVDQKAGAAESDEEGGSGFSFSESHFVGGLNTLEGADYFWFFTKVMLGTAILFVGVALLYKPREYFHEESEDEHPIDPHGGG